MKYEDLLHMECPTSKRHARMPLSERAKIFLPFAALKGYEEKISEKQKIVEDRKILTNEQKLELNDTFVYWKEILNKKENIIIKVNYYNIDHYEIISGILTKLSFEEQYLIIVNTKIYFKDIYEIINV